MMDTVNNGPNSRFLWLYAIDDHKMLRLWVAA